MSQIPVTLLTSLLSYLQFDNFELWVKPLFGGSLAVAVTSRQQQGGPRRYLLPLSMLGKGVCRAGCYVTCLLPTREEYGVLNSTSTLLLRVNPTGTVLLRID
ncbi:hypothetical protein FKM82_029892 [Ascaphus truei]